jgi:hypothetical protein
LDEHRELPVVTGVTRLRAVRRVHEVPVVLTAAVHPF